jgi:hypothetical protein
MSMLTRNTETVQEHRRRLELLGYGPLSRDMEAALFPGEAVMTPAEEQEAWDKWNARYPKGRKGDPIELVARTWAIKTIARAYSPLRRLRALVKALGRRR